MPRMQRTTALPIPTAIERPVRPTRPQAEPSGPHAGYMQHPPETCSRRVFDGHTFWVDVSLCAYHCSINATCKVWIVFQEGSKSRKKFVADETIAPPVEPPAPKINRRRS